MTVSLTITNHVATVTLNRPAAMNAIDLATEAELQRIWTQIENDPEVRLVVLTGAGERAFCAGADLKNPSVTGLEYWAAPRPGGFGGIALTANYIASYRDDLNGVFAVLDELADEANPASAGSDELQPTSL